MVIVFVVFLVAVVLAIDGAMLQSSENRCRRMKQATATSAVGHGPQRDLAGLVAAPWWALAWALSLGRFGRPLWRISLGIERPIGVPNVPAPPPPPRRGNLSSEPPGIQVPPRAFFGGGYRPASGVDESDPPRGGSGIPPATITIPGITSEEAMRNFADAARAFQRATGS